MRWLAKFAFPCTLVLVALLTMTAAKAAASGLSIAPVQVHLSPDRQSELISLHNSGLEEVRFQLTAYTWQENAAGRMVLNPTDDIIFFPTLFTLKPGEDTKVRIGSDIRADSVEKTYRLFMEQLPPPRIRSAHAAEVNVLTRIGIPIFIEPDHPHAEPILETPTLSGDKLSFRMHNEGNADTRLRSVKVTGLASDGRRVFQKTTDGWYLLANADRDFELKLEAQDCARTHEVEVEVATDQQVLERRLTLPANQCAEKSIRTAARETPGKVTGGSGGRR